MNKADKTHGAPSPQSIDWPTWSVIAELIGKHLGSSGVLAVAVFTITPQPDLSNDLSLIVFSGNEALTLHIKELLQPMLRLKPGAVQEFKTTIPLVMPV